MGLIKILLRVIVFVVLAVVALGAFLYFTDYEADGVVKEKGSDADGNYVVLRPRIVPYDFKQHIDASSAPYVCEGYQIAFRVQSHHYTVSDTQGRPVYDSDTGLSQTFAPIRCSTLGV